MNICLTKIYEEAFSHIENKFPCKQCESGTTRALSLKRHKALKLVDNSRIKNTKGRNSIIENTIDEANVKYIEVIVVYIVHTNNKSSKENDICC